MYVSLQIILFVHRKIITESHDVGQLDWKLKNKLFNFFNSRARVFFI